MNRKRNYFLYVMGEIVPEIKEKKITVAQGNDIDELHNKHGRIPDKKPFGKLFYSGKGNRLEKITTHDQHVFDVPVNKGNAERLRKMLDDSRDVWEVMGIFTVSKKPAILFQPEERTLYFLFDLEKLICSQSTLEDEFGKIDRHGRFLASFHQNEVRWKTPALEVLGKLVRESFGFSGRGIKSGIVMTHDVDRVSVEPFLFMKNIIAKQKIEKFAFTDEKDYLFQNVRALLDIDSENAIKPVWFFLSGNYSFRRYGNRYNSNSSKARKLIAAIAHRGQSIGLHTSYYGAFDPQRSLREKRNLEGLCGMPIYLNRCHYLRFEMRKSIALFEKCGLTLDSTMGYSDANGFRSGLCRPFHPWNHEEGKISKILEIPLLFMDSVHSGDVEESWNDLKRILYWVNEVRGCGAILFHPYSLASNKDIKALYKDVIEECHRLNIPFLSIDDVVNEQSGCC